MGSNVVEKVLNLIQEISAPRGIRAITPGLVASMLQLDPQKVFEAMVKLADVGLLGQQLRVMCPFCSNLLDIPSFDLDTSVTCEMCGKEFIVSNENIYVSFSYLPEKKTFGIPLVK